MKQTSIILSAFIMSLTFFSCNKVEGEGPVITEPRSETGFNGVAISVPADVIYKQAATYKLRLQLNAIFLISLKVLL